MCIKPSMRLHTPVYADFWISDRGQHSWSIDEEHSREIIRRRLELGEFASDRFLFAYCGLRNVNERPCGAVSLRDARCFVCQNYAFIDVALVIRSHGPS